MTTASSGIHLGLNYRSMAAKQERKQIRMSVDEYDDDDSTRECPYCSSTGECAHLLLIVDRTFRTAVGGVLMEVFNDRSSKLLEEGGDDFEEPEPFENLLDEVDSCADSSADYDERGGPRMSSSYSSYYVRSAVKADAAVARFVSGGAE